MDKNKLHILFLSGWFPSRVFPTNGDFVQRHAETVAQIHKVTLVHVVTDPSVSKTEIIENQQNNIHTYIAYVPKKNELIKFFFFLKTYLKIIKKIDSYDLIHLNITHPKGLIALYLKFFKKKKYIITEHWTGYQKPQSNSISLFKKLVSKIITKNAEYVCPISKNLERDMKDFGLTGNYKMIPNVVDTNIFIPDKKASKVFTIVSISNLYDKQKNITGLLNVIKKLSEEKKDFVLKLVGNADFKEIKNYIEKLDIPKNNIELISAKPQTEIAEILQQANVFISFSNYESFGLVIAESIACGTPVISTNTGILTEIDAYDYSTIIPIKNEEKLFETIVDYMENPKTYDTEKMHEFIKNSYSKKVIGNLFSDCYYDILK